MTRAAAAYYKLRGFGNAIVVPVAAAFVAAVMSLPANAQQNCSPREAMVDALATKYKESRRAYGLSNKYQVLELYASDKGTWTAVVTNADGKSCIVAAGEAWTEVRQPPSGTPL